MSALITGIILILVALLFAYLVSRARHARSGLVRWLLAIVLGFVGAFDLVGVYRLNATHPNSIANVKVAATSNQWSPTRARSRRLRTPLPRATST
jgi:hypothetical protein